MVRVWFYIFYIMSHKDLNLEQKIDILKNRRKTNFTSTISDERWDELSYNGVLISDLVSWWSIGKVIGHLWLKKDLPKYACQFIEMVMILLADHGPAVSGATNAIITARAGKDVVSSLIAGLATIWPRFGGAVTWAGSWIVDAVDRDLSPQELVWEMKKQWRLILWIWHKVKSLYNPDTRCKILQKMSSSFPSTKHLHFALEVEKITLQKKINLILNVDGHIAALLCDMLVDIWYTPVQIKKMVENDLFNSFFVLSRSIWFIGHYLDQKRLSEGLYRTPWEDINYDIA